MNDLTKDNGIAFIGLLHGNSSGLSIPKPFERDIFLFDTYVAGTSHIEGIKDLEPLLLVDDKLSFFREPNNPHDSKAIVIKNAKGIKIGYVPEKDNAIFSRLMDAGKLLYGKITSKKMTGEWLKITICVLLHE